MFTTYQQVPCVLRHAAPIANPPPLLRTGQLLHCVTVFENDSQSSSTPAPAARVKQVPAKPAQATSATALPVASGPLGSAASRVASPTLRQTAETPLIAKQATYTNRDRVDEVMLNRIGVKKCDS